MKLTLLLSLALAGLSSAATIASYNLDGGSLTATTQNYGTATDLTLGASWFTNSDGLDQSPGAALDSYTDPANLITFVFTASLNAGETLTLTNASFDYSQPAGDIAGAGGGSTVRYRIANGDSGVQDPGVSGTLSDTFTGITLSDGDSFTFQIAGRDSGNNPYLIDNIQLEGDVTTVPEPSSAILLGFGGLALLSRRKR